MFEKWNEEQLYRVARHVADAVTADTLSGLLPVDAETWGDFHSYVDANEYALQAFEELGTEVEEGEDSHGTSWAYLMMSDAEDVAWTVYRATPRLKELRGLVREGARVTAEGFVDTLTVVSSRSYRNDRVRRDIVVDCQVGDDEDDVVVVKVTDLRAA